MTSARRILILILTGAGLILAADHVPIRLYELEYFRSDPPAYHPTVMKRLIGHIVAPDAGDISGTLQARSALSILRMAGLYAALSAAASILGYPRGLWAFGIFSLMPPAIPYLVRLDPWMDSVSFVFIAIFFLSAANRAEGKKIAIFYAAAGLFTGLAIDSKLTSALTIVPFAALHFFRLRPQPLIRLRPQPLMVSLSNHERVGEVAPIGNLGLNKRLIFFSAGMATAALTQINWILHPSQAAGHVAYWSSANAALTALPVGYAPAAIFSAVPATILLLAGFGVIRAGRDKTVWASALLAGVPIIFFMFYRTFNPDGFRHLYLVLPFLAVPAADALAKFRPSFKIGFLAAWISELLLKPPFSF